MIESLPTAFRNGCCQFRKTLAGWQFVNRTLTQ
jgi:hypothetical protein